MDPRTKFIVVFLCLGLGSSCLLAGSGYYLEKQQGLAEAKLKNELLHDYTEASFNFLKNHQKPLFVELVDTKNHFYPEMVLGFRVVKKTWEIFRKNREEYDFKQATLNPMNEENRANENEARIINEFRQKPQLKKLEGTVSRNGVLFSYLATPVKVWAKDCLRCHGKPEDAPRYQLDLYGTDHGYGWQLDEIVTAEVTYVSLDKALADARSLAWKIFLISIGCVAATLAVLIIFCL